VWKAGTCASVANIIVLMQEWTIVKEIIFHKMYSLHVSVLFTQSRKQTSFIPNSQKISRYLLLLLLLLFTAIEFSLGGSSP